MKSKCVLASAIILLVLIPACGSVSNSPEPEGTSTHQSSPSRTPRPPSPNTKTSPAASTIGTVSNIRTRVFVGLRENLEQVEGKRNLGNNEFVTVADGGKARLEFPGPIKLLMYNQSEMDDIRLEFEGNSNPRIVNRLIRGGFSGYVEPGNQLTIDLAFGIQVNVLGTNFFILYDEKNGYITIGKFDGTLILSVPGQGTINMDDLEMIDIDSNGILERHLQISFTPVQFDSAADACLSPVQGVNILRRDNHIPQPGKKAFEADIKIPCEPFPSAAILPTGGCEKPTAYVKASRVQLREGPDLRFNSIGDYLVNDQLVILGQYRGWYNVEFPDQKKGWLYRDWISIPQGVELNNICNITYRDLPPTPKHKEDVCKSSKYVVCP